jgi:hypothetical protein
VEGIRQPCAGAPRVDTCGGLSHDGCPWGSQARVILKHLAHPLPGLPPPRPTARPARPALRPTAGRQVGWACPGPAPSCAGWQRAHPPSGPILRGTAPPFPATLASVGRSSWRSPVFQLPARRAHEAGHRSPSFLGLMR